jgi:NitT/TauT family transport system ATP-binding protein
LLTGRPGCVRSVTNIDIPLNERAASGAALEGIRQDIWEQMREQAARADREMRHV